MNKNKGIKDYILNGNIDLDMIVDDYTPYVRSVINNMVHENLKEEDKEEIIIDTFFVLWKRYTDNYYIESLGSYIAGITRNLVKDKLKKIKYTVDISDYENLLGNDNLELYSIEREEISILKNKLKNLKKTDVIIINMFYYSSKSIKDIARELNISEVNVKTKLHRIRRKIKKELKDGGF